MSTYFTDFEEYSTGSVPSDWTVRINADDLWTVETTGSDKYLQVDDPDANQYLSWNDIDADSERQDVEILFKWQRSAGSSGNKPWAFARLTGNSSAFSGYRTGGTGTNFQIFRAISATAWSSIGSVAFTHSGTTDYWVRFRVNGTTVQARIWLDGDSEPGTWDIDVTDSNISGDGWAGVGAVTSNATTFRYWQVGVGTNGDTAPASAGSGGYTLTCAAGSYTLTGQSAVLLASRRLAAEQGSYALTGQAATLQRSQRLAAEPGAYSLTGQAAGLRAARRLVADAGTYALTGVAAILARSRVLAAEQGAYVLTGQAAGLTYTAPGSYVLACDAGSYSLNGQAVNLRAARRLVAAPGSYALTGQAAGLSKIAGYTLAADAGSYTLTGQAAGLARTRVLQCAAGAYTLTGQAATLTYSGVQAPVLSVAPLGRLLSTAARPPAVSSARRPANLSTRTR